MELLTDIFKKKHVSLMKPFLRRNFKIQKWKVLISWISKLLYIVKAKKQTKIQKKAMKKTSIIKATTSKILIMWKCEKEGKNQPHKNEQKNSNKIN